MYFILCVFTRARFTACGKPQYGEKMREKKNTIIKIAYKNNFSVVPNAAMQNPKLSWQARGLLAYLLTLPKHWQIHVSELPRHSTCGETATRSAMRELISAKYVVDNQIREKGRFTRHEYLVYASPQKSKRKASAKIDDLDLSFAKQERRAEIFAQVDNDMIERDISSDHLKGRVSKSNTRENAAG